MTNGIASSSGGGQSTIIPSDVYVGTVMEVEGYELSGTDELINDKQLRETDVYEVARNKIKDTILQTVEEFNLSEAKDSINDEQLGTLANRLVEFIEKIDVNCPFPTATRVAEFLEAAVWWKVEEKWVLMLPDSSLGQGTDSTVYRGLLREGQECAVKCWNQKTEEWLQTQNNFYKQMSFSPHIIQPFATDENYGIELLCRGNIDDVRKENRNFIKNHIQQINKGILQGIVDIHAKDYVYSDLKLKNVLITEEGHVIFGDFGDCCSIESLPSKGTYAYWAPERFNYHLEVHKEGKPEHPLPHAQKGDIWQVMLALADLNETALSEPFLERLDEYTSKQYELAMELERSAIELKESGLEQPALELEFSKIVLRYAEDSAAHLNELRMKRDGLFSDLVPTRQFEKLLIEMSMFDPAKRISAANALERLKEFGV